MRGAGSGVAARRGAAGAGSARTSIRPMVTRMAGSFSAALGADAAASPAGRRS
jgi:hypothetical protein